MSQFLHLKIEELDGNSTITTPFTVVADSMISATNVATVGGFNKNNYVISCGYLDTELDFNSTPAIYVNNFTFNGDVAALYHKITVYDKNNKPLVVFAIFYYTMKQGLSGNYSMQVYAIKPTATYENASDFGQWDAADIFSTTRVAADYRALTSVAIKCICETKADGKQIICIYANTLFQGFSVPNGETNAALYLADGTIINNEDIFKEREWQGGDSEDEGGFGGGDNSSDDITFSPLPTVDLVGAHVFQCNISNIKALNDYLWSKDFLDLVGKYFNSPSEAIIGLSLINTSLPAGEAKNIIIGNATSDISAIEINNWLEVDCGSLNIAEYFGNYVDYSPTTDCTLFLPYVGFVPIDTDVVMNNTISIHYLIELISGSGLVELMIKNNRDDNTYIYQTYPCACTMTIPLSATDKNSMVSSLISLCGSVGTGLISGGKASAVLGTATVQGAVDVFGSKNHVQPISGQGQVMGFLGHRKPYVIIKRCTISHPSSYPSNYGYPNNTTRAIGTMNGFTKIKSCHLEFDTELIEEKNEIMNLLQNGIML